MPEVAMEPDQVPLAEHAVALVEDHVRVVDEPITTEGGLAVIVMVGGGLGVVSALFLLLLTAARVLAHTGRVPALRR